MMDIDGFVVVTGLRLRSALDIGEAIAQRLQLWADRSKTILP